MPSTSDELRQLEMYMFALLNSARNVHLPRWLGTAHLTWHDGLAAVARGHSADMLRRQYVAHVRLPGWEPRVIVGSLRQVWPAMMERLRIGARNRC